MKVKNKALYWGLIFTFAALYLAVAFVSTLHAITFFQLANTLGLAILLGAAYEVGQASVLFSILMTENKNKLLAWLMMILLTSLQVTANVYASFKFMDSSGSQDWTYWQRAILFAVQAENAEMYKVIISWISGALLPIVALGMTALVAENIRLAKGEDVETPPLVEEQPIVEEPKKIDEKPQTITESEDFTEAIKEEFKKLDEAEKISKEQNIKFPVEAGTVKKHIELNLQEEPTFPTNSGSINDNEIEEIKDKKIEKKPKNPFRGWHFMSEFVDENHDVYNKGKFVMNDPSKPPTPKKA